MTEIDRSRQPEIHEIGDFSLPSPIKGVLSNGIRTFYFENRNLDLIYILLQIRTGSLYQTKKHVCHYAYMLLRESSGRFLPEEIAEKLDFFGTNITTNVGLDKVQIVISVPKRNIGEILPLISDFLINPKYRDESLQLFKEKEIKNLAYNEQKTDYVSWRLMWREMLGTTYPEIGRKSSPEVINSITIRDLEEFHGKSFVAENISLFYTGNVGQDTAKLIGEAFSKIPHGENSPELPVAVSAPKKDVIFEAMPGCMQSSIILCFPSISYNDPERMKFSVLSTLTGGYFGSRLMSELRERRGYTYGISASSSYFGRQSVFAVSSDVNAGDTRAAIEACFREIATLTSEIVRNEELDMVKKYMIGLNLRSIDTSVNAMQKFAYFSHFGSEEAEMRRYISEIKNVTPEDVFLLAKKYFDYNKFSTIVVGEYREED